MLTLPPAISGDWITSFMQNPTWYLNRLKSMDAAEIRWRIASLVRDQFDLARIPLQRYPHLPAAAIRSPAGFEPGFRCTAVDRSAWTQLDRDIAERWTARLREKADQVCANRLSYFDLDNEFHGDPFVWHRDFSAAKDCPVVHVNRTDYRRFSRFGDCKLVWEPNRHHQLVVLGRAYRVTGELRYAQKATDLMLSWIEANPFGYGMNWKSPLELGIRLINWVWVLDLTRDAGILSDDQFRRIQETCYLAMWDIQRKLSRGSSANNHLLGEAAGVYIAACYFAHFPHTETWRRRCKDILESELLAQTYADGGTREHAFGYQFFVLQFAVLCSLAGQQCGDRFSASFLERLHQMFRFLHEMSLDTGSPPQVGDKDDGYVLDLGELPTRADKLIAVGGVLFDDEQLLAREASETCFWLFGQRGLGSRVAKAEPRPVQFAVSGYSILRGPGAAKSSEGQLSAFFDCAELGYGPIAAHGHADSLSFTLNLGQRRVLVDAGTYDYFTYPSWREYFRSTRAHNTVEIDGQSQSESLGLFLWGRKANARWLEWRDTPHLTVVSGEHDGYTRLPSPLIHRRTLELDKTSQRLTVVDTLEGQGSHTGRWHFHLDPACTPTQVDRHTVNIRIGDRIAQVRSETLEFSLIRAGDTEQRGWISRSYHHKEPSTCIVSEVEFTGNYSATTEIAVLA